MWLTPLQPGRRHVREIGADVPKPGSDVLVVTALGGFLGFAVGEVVTRLTLQMRSRGHVNGSGGALGRGLHEMPQDWDEQSLDCGGVFGSKRCIHRPRVHHVGGDDSLIEQRCGLQPPGQLVREQDVGELGGPGFWTLR